MNNICEKLDEAIVRRLDEMENLNIGSDSMAKAIDEAAKLHELRIKEVKLMNEDGQRFLEQQSRTVDELAREEEFKQRKRERIIGFGISAAEIILPLALYGWLSYVGYAREFDGMVTSDTLKRVLNSIKPKR